MLSASPLFEVMVDPAEPSAPVESIERTTSYDSSAHDGSLADNEFRVSESSSEVGRHEADRVEQARRLELVFVDTAADDYRQLVDDLLANGDSEGELEVYLLDSSHDGVAQIREILAGYADVDAIHLVSHGAEGQVKLGSTWLTASRFDRYFDEIAGWNSSLRSGADFLIYGCNLAASEDGRELVEMLGAACDCDVAASVDDTGHTRLGGDWDLEFVSGVIESGSVFSESLQLSPRF